MIMHVGSVFDNFRDDKYLYDPDLCMLPIHAVHYGEAENLTWGPEQDVVCLCTLANKLYSQALVMIHDQ